MFNVHRINVTKLLFNLSTSFWRNTNTHSLNYHCENTLLTHGCLFVYLWRKKSKQKHTDQNGKKPRPQRRKPKLLQMCVEWRHAIKTCWNLPNVNGLTMHDALCDPSFWTEFIHTFIHNLITKITIKFSDNKIAMLIDNERCNRLMKLIRNFWQLRFEYVQEEMCARNVCVCPLSIAHCTWTVRWVCAMWNVNVSARESTSERERHRELAREMSKRTACMRMYSHCVCVLYTILYILD